MPWLGVAAMSRGLKLDLAADLLPASFAANLLVVLLPGSIVRSAFQIALQGYNTWYDGH